MASTATLQLRAAHRQNRERRNHNGRVQETSLQVYDDTRRAAGLPTTADEILLELGIDPNKPHLAPIAPATPSSPPTLLRVTNPPSVSSRNSPPTHSPDSATTDTYSISLELGRRIPQNSIPAARISSRISTGKSSSKSSGKSRTSRLNTGEQIGENCDRVSHPDTFVHLVGELPELDTCLDSADLIRDLTRFFRVTVSHLNLGVNSLLYRERGIRGAAIFVGFPDLDRISDGPLNTPAAEPRLVHLLQRLADIKQWLKARLTVLLNRPGYVRHLKQLQVQ